MATQKFITPKGIVKLITNGANKVLFIPPHVSGADLKKLPLNFKTR